MGCDACQDCDSSNLSLPVAQEGTPGATGPQGPQGPPGNNGTPGIPGTGGFIILHNDGVFGYTSSATYAPFVSAKNYTLPLNTASNNGDIVEINATFETTSEFIGSIDYMGYEITLGGSAIGSGGNIQPYEVFNWDNRSNQAYLKVKLRLSRYKSTQFMIHSDNYVCDVDGRVLDHYHFSNYTTAVADLSLNPLAIEIKGKTSNGVLVCKTMDVSLFKI